jgi:16S rRNA (guanine966-N2)-methyltransferase
VRQRRPNELRIIGGRWRGRRLRFPDAAGLRPTPDRVRETLFNWLSPVLPGARCLDLFAGSGVLGLEALSRGAATAVLVDKHSAVVAQLRATVALLGADQADVLWADALPFLQGEEWRGAHDIVFVDPPYRLDLLEPCCSLLEQRGWLADRAYIYLESPSQGALPLLPPRWRIVRSDTAGEVAYRLALRGEE